MSLSFIKKIVNGIAFASIYLSYTQAMDLNQIVKYIKEDNCAEIDKALNLGFDPNYLIDVGDDDCFTLLTFAISNHASKVSNKLIQRGADINEPCIAGRFHYTPLFLSVIKKVSVDVLKNLLEKGANVDCIGIKPKFLSYSEKKISLFHIFNSRGIQPEKKQYIIEFFFRRYGKNLLLKALNHQCSLGVISTLVENGAYVPKNVVEIATKLKSKKTVIEFLEYQINMINKLNELLPVMPNDLNDLIAEYSYGSKEE